MQEFESRIVQFVANYCSDYAIPDIAYITLKNYIVVNLVNTYMY
jgi:hypothetical protein